MLAPKRMNAPRRMNAAQPPTMFPHTVTVYNTYKEEDDNYRETVTNYITILSGVFLDATKVVNVRETGLEGADAVDLYIPPTAKATDGVTGKEVKYVGPREFYNATNRTGMWTLSDTGTTFFIKGNVVQPDSDRQALELAYDDVYSVTKVDVKDYGGLRHIEVGGA